jgi:hypothetical protein
MKEIIHCTVCGIPVDLDEVRVNNSLEFACEDCWEEWDLEDNGYADNYL